MRSGVQVRSTSTITTTMYLLLLLVEVMVEGEKLLLSGIPLYLSFALIAHRMACDFEA